MKILTYTTLYPNVVQPHHGVFVEHRMRHLAASHPLECRVVAPVPWFPFRHPRFGRYARFRQVPRDERRHGFQVVHPRYPVIPKVGMTLSPWLLALATRRALSSQLRAGFDFDLIDAHYFYPDGVAAVILGRWLRKPVVVTARGTDLNLIPRYRLPRRMILRAARAASAVVCVCEALREELARLGESGSKVRVLRNGVDLELFRPVDRAATRERLGIDSTTLLSVGHLIERKGHDLVIRSLRDLPGYRLILVGDGVLRGPLEELARSLGVADRVRFTGAVAQAELRELYGAADALVLASSREGWANVLLESMACGTPVVATDVWGTPEVVQAPEAGVLVPSRSAESIAQSVRRLFESYPDRAATRRYAERFDWAPTSRGLRELFDEITNTGGRAGS